MILSILDIKKQIIKYLIFTIFCLVLGIIYEHFSHNVFSIYMSFAFIIPFFGLLVNSFIYKFKIKTDIYSNKFFNYGIITFTVGSLLKGALDIYGTTNKLLYLYIVFGLFFIVISLITRIVKS